MLAKNPHLDFNTILGLLNDMLLAAYESQDELLIGQTYRNFAFIMVHFQRYDFAAPYALGGVQLVEKIKPKLIQPFDYLMLGGLLFEARNYEEAIFYAKKGLTGTESKESKDHIIFNTIGQSFERLNQLDSAKSYYNLVDSICDLNGHRLWKYINLQNIGEIQFKEKNIPAAKESFRSVYKNGIDEVSEIAAKSLVWLAKIQLQENNLDSALSSLDEAEFILKNFSDRRLQTEYFLEDSYFTKLVAFEKLGLSDSSSFYFRKYLSLHDSLAHLASLADLSVVQTRIDHAEKTYNLGLLKVEKYKAEQRRNAIIVAILVFSAIGFTYFNWQKKRLQYKNKITTLEKEAKESEIKTVKNQLKSFTNQLLEKAKLLEELENELDSKNEAELHSEYLAKLNSSRILTDKDWSEFKLLFEKVYPGFFTSIKEKFPTITPAEMRISALIRLQFSAKEMADILGVSVDSAHKTRQRLRQRMELSSDTNLEEFISNF
ncbi:hypothetical protein [Algoriphagus sp. CAU 1675]|uniref:tetratricopeptide repeat protein n=1 Tax=Algoriphagus sp. CAU 1675 TaxID=3032597 RepID=UPI0023DAC801|nr:hypothetical protein [Algoriphagus sp. CAU 1675]MDF2156331.1 hypothetical protein [Algoriphagus sp. CAU 1675]